ncbi:YphA family membrane protein [Lentibacillus salicampi]|uniref:Uncharacterized protein n=1 Tax=Lentibacillus salicampi TaxID=175306 RepID=A0A4Y9AEN2_9BACI|nr:hypothetical protein [Lentibacillus salicampi]TFJ93802.1 hypothetical protein E4U82_05425 [Lentibacillus salicampi]
MYSGLLFYWFSWILWVIVTFFMKKSRYRAILACWLLLLVLCSEFHISFEPYEMTLSYLVILSGALMLHARIPGIFFHLFVSFTIMIGYTAALIWESHVPLKHFFSPTLAISCFLFVLIVLMTSGLWHRLACGLLGMAGGEMLYSLIIANYSILDVTGDKRFLDLVSVIILSLVCHDSVLRLTQTIVKRFRKSIAKSKPLFRKQAQ